ncbi:recombinase family protein [Bacillus zanthoxyli]|nr:recombinase family protein [Bacillus zanthoxyli]
MRVSTNKEEQKTSLENQQQFFFNILAEKGWELFRFYIDVESGTDYKKRKNLRQLIEDAKHKKFDIILSKELSRLARNGKLSYEIKDIAEKNHIHIITFDGAINSLEGNINMFGLYSWIYEQEAQRTSERIKMALNTKAKKGDFTGSNPPYGYRVVNHKLYYAQDNTPAIVEEIFRLYISGKGFDSIARYLSNQGYPTPAQISKKKNAGKYWHGSTVKLILQNPHYVGDLVQGRETSRSVTVKTRENVPKEKYIVIKNAHEPIISREDFATVQRLMNTRKKNITKAKKHLFTNILYCAECGTGMWYRQNRDGYICGKYAKHGKKACTANTVKEKALKELILRDIKKFTKKINDKQFSFKSNTFNGYENLAHEIEEIETYVQNIQQKKKRYLEMLAEYLITHQEYRDSANDFNEQINELELKKSELKASLPFKDTSEDFYLLKNTLNKYSSSTDVNEEMLHCFVKRIEVDKKRFPKITYHFSIMND